MQRISIMDRHDKARSFAEAPARSEGPTLTRAPRRVKILLVDDNADNLVSLEAALDGLNEELILARSGMEALRHVLENDFAAILLDVKMPDMDGLETAEIIRSRKGSRNTPIIFLTGYRNEEHLFRGYTLGAVDFLFKPIVPEILRSKVSAFVELWRSLEIQKDQAEALRKTEQQFRSLLEAAPDAMVISKEDGEIVLVNSRTETIFGCRRDRVLGRNIRTFVPDWNAHLLVASGKESTDLTACRSDGSEFPASITSSPLRTEEGVLITSAIRDATERVKAEECIRRLNLELEQRVTERTAALQRSNDQLTQFAYAASHDLQEPLRMVVSYTQLLERRYKNQLDSDADQFINYAVEGALRLESLLKGLREYLQVEEERPIELVDCNLVLEQVLRNLESAIFASGAAIT
ncbi:MAG: response regulator, partial [Bryobacteraceae bacterium]